MTRSFDPWIFQGILGSVLQASIVASICLACSVRLSPALSAAVGLTVFAVGSLSGELVSLLLGGSKSKLIVFVKAILPDLSALAFKDSAVEHLPLSFGQFCLLMAYTLGWIGLCLFVAKTTFEEIDL